MRYEVHSAGRDTVRFHNSLAWNEFHKKLIEKMSRMRYNYCVNLFIQADRGSSPIEEMR